MKQTAHWKNTQQTGRLLKRVGKQLSFEGVFDHFQGALLYLDQFGICAGLTMGFLLTSSLLQQVAIPGQRKESSK
jgi:hypothetical protein